METVPNPTHAPAPKARPAAPPNRPRPVVGEDTARIDVTPIQRAEVAELQARYGVTAWFGFHTREWWALVDGSRLVEAPTPARLGEAVMAARRWTP